MQFLPGKLCTCFLSLIGSDEPVVVVKSVQSVLTHLQHPRIISVPTQILIFGALSRTKLRLK